MCGGEGTEWKVFGETLLWDPGVQSIHQPWTGSIFFLLSLFLNPKGLTQPLAFDLEFSH